MTTLNWSHHQCVWPCLWDRLEKEGADTAEMVEALLYLANFYKRAERYRDAEACCMRLLDFAGPAKQDAKAGWCRFTPG
jgi:hypothetical protein